MKLHKKRSNIFVSVIKENYSLLIVLIGLTFLISIQGCQPSEPTLTIGGPTCCEILKLDGTTESCISDINEVKCSESVTTGGYNFYYNGCRDVPSCLDIIKLSSVADLKENNLVFAHSSDLSKLYKYDFNKGSNELIQSFTNNIIRIDFIEDNLVTAWTAPYGGPYTANIVDLNKKSILKSYSTWPNYTYPRIYKINNNYYYYALNKPNSLEFYLTKINLDTAQQTNVLYKPFLGYSVDGILYDDYNIILFYWGSPGLGSYRHEIISVNVNTDKETILFSETRSSSTDILYKVINSKADNGILIADIYSKDPKYDPLRYHTRAFDLINNRQYSLDKQYRANTIAIYNSSRFLLADSVLGYPNTIFLDSINKITVPVSGRLMNDKFIIDATSMYYYVGLCDIIDCNITLTIATIEYFYSVGERVLLTDPPDLKTDKPDLKTDNLVYQSSEVNIYNNTNYDLWNRQSQYILYNNTIQEPTPQGYIIQFRDKPVLEKKLELEAQGFDAKIINLELKKYRDELIEKHTETKAKIFEMLSRKPSFFDENKLYIFISIIIILIIILFLFYMSKIKWNIGRFTLILLFIVLFMVFFISKGLTGYTTINFQKDINTLNEYTDVFNGIALNISIDEARQLKRLDYVKEIYPNEKVNITLMDTIPLLNIDSIWNQTDSQGRIITGKDIKIVIIDTGVDYTHPDLGGCNLKIVVEGNIEPYTLESPHPYPKYYDNTWTITMPGFTNIAVHFSNLDVAREYVVLYDGEDNIKQVLTGNQKDVWSSSIEGDTIKVRLYVSKEKENWGFAIDKVVNGITRADWSSCNKVIGGYDFVYPKDNDPMDDQGHGTHVAATAAGNGILKGVAPDAKIVAYKVLNSRGQGASDAIIAAIERTMDPNQDGDFSDHYDIISMSLGGSGNPDDPMSQAVDNAVNNGVVAVIAAGNSGPAEQTIASPGTARKAITVGASDKNNLIAGFSSRGPILYGDEVLVKPDILAPGVSICAAQWNDWLTNYRCYDDKHIAIAGTSMATPHISGIVALLKQAHPDWSPDKIKNILMETSINLSYNVYEQGSGMVNISNALNPLVEVSSLPLNLGLHQKSFNSSFLIKNMDSKNHGIRISAGDIKKIYTDESFNAISIDNSELCLENYINVSFRVNTDIISYGVYSGLLSVEVFSDCTFSSIEKTINVPLGFGKIKKVILNFNWPQVFDKNEQRSLFVGYFTNGTCCNEYGRMLEWPKILGIFWLEGDVSTLSTFSKTLYIYEPEDLFEVFADFDTGSGIISADCGIYDCGYGAEKWKKTYIVKAVDLSGKDAIEINIDEASAKHLNTSVINFLGSKNMNIYEIVSMISRYHLFSWMGGIITRDHAPNPTISKEWIIAADTDEALDTYQLEMFVKGKIKGKRYNESDKFAFLASGPIKTKTSTLEWNPTQTNEFNITTYPILKDTNLALAEIMPLLDFLPPGLLYEMTAFTEPWIKEMIIDDKKYEDLVKENSMFPYRNLDILLTSKLVPVKSLLGAYSITYPYVNINSWLSEPLENDMYFNRFFLRPPYYLNIEVDKRIWPSGELDSTITVGLNYFNQEDDDVSSYVHGIGILNSMNETTLLRYPNGSITISQQIPFVFGCVYPPTYGRSCEEGNYYLLSIVNSTREDNPPCLETYFYYSTSDGFTIIDKYIGNYIDGHCIRKPLFLKSMIVNNMDRDIEGYIYMKTQWYWGNPPAWRDFTECETRTICTMRCTIIECTTTCKEVRNCGLSIKEFVKIPAKSYKPLDGIWEAAGGFTPQIPGRYRIYAEFRDLNNYLISYDVYEFTVT